MMTANELINLLEYELFEDYATKVVNWLEGKFDLTWGELKASLTKMFSTRVHRLSIYEVECDNTNIEMWAENGDSIYVCDHISLAWNSEGYDEEGMKAKLLHELSHIIRQRNKKGLKGTPHILSQREYPARAFEVAWVLSQYYGDVYKFIKDFDARVGNAYDLDHNNQALRMFNWIRSNNKNSVKFVALTDKYVKILRYYRRKYGFTGLET